MSVPPTREQNPYPGLQPFKESEKDRFFGRDEEIHILTDKILANRMTLLVAASGAGKSSLLQAGVMPALRAGGMADLIYHNDWALDPLAGLKQTVVKHLIEGRRIGPEYRPDPDQSLDRFLRIHSLLVEGMQVILLDQFEEFFYYHRFSQQRDRFVEQLAAAVRDAETPAAFVFSMREDFAMELNAFKPHLRSVFDTVYRIEKLKPGAARLAIEKPAQNLGVTYQAELIERLLNDLGSRERENRPSYENFDAPLLIEPPHLQIVCRELWQKAAPGEDRCIGLPHYDSLGGAKGVLEGYFQHKMRSLTGEQQRLASRAFDHLVSQHGAKMAYPLQELADRIGAKPQSLQDTLDLLQKAAILRRVQRQEQPWYELYHDIFAQSINTWNRGYKERELRKRLRRRVVYALLACVSGWLAYDGYINRHDRHLRLGKETVSERVEMVRGAWDSTDVFSQQKFLFEADFERLDLQADKRFEQSRLGDLSQDQAFQIGLLPLLQRFIAYARNGLYEKAFKVADDMRTSKDGQLLGHLIRQLPDVRADSVLDQFDKIRKADKKNAKSVNTALLSLNAESAVKPLIEELQNADSSVRMAAIEVLGQLKAGSAIPLLIERLKDDDAYVRRAAIEALAQLKGGSAIPLLIERLKDNDADVRRAAVGALGQLKAGSAIPFLIERLKDDDWQVREVAVGALAQLKAGSAIPLLIERLKDDDADVRRAAIKALGQLKAGSAIPLLIERLKDND
ncbi:MAG: HEAT repeat domain-containing protein, partial [Methylococcales bacterium]